MTTPGAQPDPTGPEEPDRGNELPAAPPLSERDARASRPSRRPAFLGLAVGLVLYVLLLGLVAAGDQDADAYWALELVLAMVVVTVVLIIAGVVMVTIERTRLFAAGLLISVAIGVVLDSGVCVAVGLATE